jgi:hypothetical protein
MLDSRTGFLLHLSVAHKRLIINATLNNKAAGTSMTFLPDLPPLTVVDINLEALLARLAAVLINFE